MSKSSKRWLQEHFSDEYVIRAKKDGYRSRAIYKLIELQDKDRLIMPGMTVIDLGAAPGGWSQLAVKLVGHKGRVIALDILSMDSLAGVEFLQGDFREDAVFEQLVKLLDGDEVDLVISDMAPNMSGNKAVDIPRSMYLVELAFDLARKVLRKDGSLMCKLFHGDGFDGLVKSARQEFTTINLRKPKASRDRSRESYLVAKGFKVARADSPSIG